MGAFVRALLIAGVLISTVTVSYSASTAAQQQNEIVTSGTVVSATRRTMVVRTESGQHVLFILERDTIRPRIIQTASTVNVVSRPDPEGTQIARSVTVTAAPPEPSQQAKRSEPIPVEVRQLEREIERQVRRYRVGVRAGVGLDPEVIIGGVHARLGPFFNRDVFFRPNAEFGFGEVTKLFAVNLEAAYRLPLSARQSRWSAYVGAGPGFNFIDRDFEEAQSGDRDIDFGDFDYESSLNIFTGVEFRTGMLLELKATAFSRPQVRLLLGYNF
jgi:hypothetical protein